MKNTFFRLITHIQSSVSSTQHSNHHENVKTRECEEKLQTIFCDDELHWDNEAGLEASSGPAVLMLTETRRGQGWASPGQPVLSSQCNTHTPQCTMRYQVRKHALNKSPTQDQFKEKIRKEGFYWVIVFFSFLRRHYHWLCLLLTVRVQCTECTSHKMQDTRCETRKYL